MILIDRYAYTNRLKNLNPMAKFIFAIGMLIFSLNIKDYRINLAVFVFLFVLIVGIAGIPIMQYIKLLLIPMIFLILSIIPILITFTSHGVVIYPQSIITSRTVFFRTMACISSTYFIALTTPMNQLIVVFNTLRFHKVFIELLILVYRFIFIFLDECQEIHNAQEMRFGYNNRKNSYKSLGLLVRILFVKIMIKYEDLIISLDSKLYDGEFKM